MSRYLSFLKLILAMLVLMYIAWILGKFLLPQQILQPFFSNRFSTIVEEFSFWRVFIVNFLVGFLGVQFMNLFRVGKYPGGIYVLPIFWILYGLLLGTNSFVFAGEPVPLSISVLWTRTGFNELLAYTLGYESSRDWALWKQQGLWKVNKLEGKTWNPQLDDLVYWTVGLVFLLIAVVRETA